MATYLELCQEYRAEIGIPGDGPITVENQIGELQRVVQDIKNAAIDIERRWNDWKFLWNTFSTNTVAGANYLTITKPSDLNRYNTPTAWVNKNTDDALNLEYVDWDEWTGTRAVGVIATGDPYEYTVRPDGQIRLYPTPTEVVPFNIEYWRKPSEMAEDDDVSRIPEEYHRIIIARAKLYYAEREDAPEIMLGSSAEYDTLLTELEANYLRDQDIGKQARAVRPNVVIVE